MINQPLISVIVPNYNHEKFLEKRLETIINQSYTNFEVILLDDCSTDNSRDILLKYAKHPKVIHCIFNDINSGNTFQQWKKGVELAKGEFIWIAESDDYCDNNFLETVCHPLLIDDQIAISYCQSHKVDSNNNIIGNWKTYTDSLFEEQFSNDFVLEGNVFIEKYLVQINVIPNASAVLFRKDNLKISDELIYNPALRYCGDWVIYFKTILNRKIAFFTNSMNNFRSHENSVIATALKSKNRVFLIDVELQMRKFLMEDVLKNEYLENSKRIFFENKRIVNEIKYDKALELFNNKQKWKAIIVLLGIVEVFIKRYPFRKRFNQLINFY